MPPIRTVNCLKPFSLHWKATKQKGRKMVVRNKLLDPDPKGTALCRNVQN